MRSYTLLAAAKINLYLEILGDRPDGYHELAMILQSLDLSDRLELRPNGTTQIRVFCHHPQVPLDDTNLAYRAALLMSRTYPQVFANFGGLDIFIEKQIPVAAGLAGGSTNAAAVLVGVNLMWQLGLTQPELQVLAAQLGSDVAFCIAGGTAIATGRGELLDPIQDLHHLFVVLAKHRSLSVSTPWAYQTYRQQFGSTYLSNLDQMRSRSREVHSGPLVQAIVNQNGAKVGQLLHNDLEKVVLPAYPQIQKLRDDFAQTGVLGTMMSGSGPTVFALCESRQQAEQVQQQVQAIADPDVEFWQARLCSLGIRVGS